MTAARRARCVASCVALHLTQAGRRADLVCEGTQPTCAGRRPGDKPLGWSGQRAAQGHPTHAGFN